MNIDFQLWSRSVRPGAGIGRTGPGDAGFSLLEALVVVGILMAMAVMVFPRYRAARELLDADSAIAEVVSQMRFARQIAIDERRDVRIDLLGTQSVQVVRFDDAVNTTVMADVALPAGYTFAMPAGAPDTPDGFGNVSPVTFGGATGGTFLADGTFVDDAGAILNGTVFTMAAPAGTARAATLTGATGRVRRYAWVNAGWEAQ